MGRGDLHLRWPLDCCRYDILWLEPVMRSGHIQLCHASVVVRLHRFLGIEGNQLFRGTALSSFLRHKKKKKKKPCCLLPATRCLFRFIFQYLPVNGPNNSPNYSNVYHNILSCLKLHSQLYSIVESLPSIHYFDINVYIKYMLNSYNGLISQSR